MNASDVVHGLSFDFSFPQSQHNSETPMEVSETIFQRLYLIYMPCCVVIGSTGNAMVWILIKGCLCVVQRDLFIVFFSIESSIIAIDSRRKGFHCRSNLPAQVVDYTQRACHQYVGCADDEIFA
ncbi:unnamed protein product [Nippostrongylus brasiliensis]|uniref:G_PROTEIN_RECEP_F1_2 domain-containing protein n=1 Tax=Nippostrongylus brasiliensis TaxID=27835 RepID=A0A0N4YEA7_NIPBR|nr:unnamed protein product [Nippostrongylus brasiliensis]